MNQLRTSTTSSKSGTLSAFSFLATGMSTSLWNGIGWDALLYLKVRKSESACAQNPSDHVSLKPQKEEEKLNGDAAINSLARKGRFGCRWDLFQYFFRSLSNRHHFNQTVPILLR